MTSQLLDDPILNLQEAGQSPMLQPLPLLPPRRLRILIVHKRVLIPADSGGKLRLLTLLRQLAPRHDITCCCNALHEEMPNLAHFRQIGVRVEPVPFRIAPRRSARFYAQLAVSLASSRPFSVTRNHNRALRRRVRSLLRTQPYDLILCDGAQLAPHIPLDRTIPAVLFQHNIEAEIFARHAEQADSAGARLLMREQARRMRQFERALGAQFDACIAVSERDRQHFTNSYGWRRVHAIDTAADADYFHPLAHEREIPGRILFVGALDWLPNEQGLAWFVRDVWHRVRNAHPNAELKIVGRNPSSAILRLHAPAEGVHVTGEVPDVRPHLAEAAVCVVPLLVGGGTRLKIFEAMACARAVVSTALGAEGLPVRNGTHLLIADDAARFARAVVAMLESKGLRRRLAMAAHELVTTRFTAPAVARQFERALLATADLADFEGEHES